MTSFFDSVQNEIHPEYIAGDMTGDDKVELEFLGPLPVVLGIVHSNERADACRREPLERFLGTFRAPGHLQQNLS